MNANAAGAIWEWGVAYISERLGPNVLVLGWVLCGVDARTMRDLFLGLIWYLDREPYSVWAARVGH